ncbi:hypothetical protein [Reichenbachiella versicolor]|uniref:hypothetical protein n=1 Tax=Reichenbachiella versicolor TaxID=1821036 RepID=UPI000D6E6BD4|nr:hypothetical protein [Reichenbachiella versicolor]
MARLITISNRVTDSIKQLLANNVLGTPGRSMVYQQLNTLIKIGRIPSPIFTSIVRNDKTLGTCCFCEREEENQNNYYVRYFSFDHNYRSSSAKRYKTKKNSRLRTEIKDFLSGKLFSSSRSSLFYAYVDPNNTRSQTLCDEFGFETIRKFRTYNFSRFNPSRNIKVTKATKEEYPQIQELLQDQYKKHSCYTEENLFYNGDYYILKNSDNQIIAGVQANPEYWNIISLAGKHGRTLIETVSKLPFVNKLINNNFKFVALDYLFSKQASKEEIQSLIESTLVIHQMNTAIISVDLDSYEAALMSSMNLGLLNKINSAVDASVICKINNFSTEKRKELFNRPFFISTFDLT